ncbi:MAG: TolC family protein, partial [Acidobacteriota bacterium]|nr:TolC family protein [Acidobacteriota bacterium]
MRSSLTAWRVPLVTLLGLSAAALGAQENSGPPPLTLSAAVERALGRYPAVTAARARVAEAAENTGEAQASRGPIVKLNASALGYDDPMITSPIHSFHPSEIPPFNETLAQGSLNLSYTLIDSGARGERERQAVAQEAVADAALSATEQAIAARVA